MTFKVGDRVRLVESPYAGDYYVVGALGTIVDIYNGFTDRYRVKADGVDGVPVGNGANPDLGFYGRQLELIENTNKENTKMTNLGMIANSTGLTVVIGTDIHTVANDHPNFEAIKAAYAAQDADTLTTLISVRKTLEKVASNSGVNIRVEGGRLFYGDREMKNGLAQRIIRLLREGEEGFAQPLIAFMENLMLNPSYRAVEGLYEWLERSSLPITPDGHFIAWKIVSNDFTDLRTGTFDNSPGSVVEIPRNEVNEDPSQTCSYGLHFCSNEYLPQYGGFYGGSGGRSKVVMVKVNPRDVGAFPHDYGISKGRCCRYEVLCEVSPSEIEKVTQDTKTGSGLYRDNQPKTVTKIETRGDRAEITLIFADGTSQLTKNRLGDTTSFEQKGRVVTLLPSGRTITVS